MNARHLHGLKALMEGAGVERSGLGRRAHLLAVHGSGGELCGRTIVHLRDVRSVEMDRGGAENRICHASGLARGVLGCCGACRLLLRAYTSFRSSGTPLVRPAERELALGRRTPRTAYPSLVSLESRAQSIHLSRLVRAGRRNQGALGPGCMHGEVACRRRSPDSALTRPACSAGHPDACIQMHNSLAGQKSLVTTSG